MRSVGTALRIPNPCFRLGECSALLSRSLCHPGGNSCEKTVRNYLSTLCKVPNERVSYTLRWKPEIT